MGAMYSCGNSGYTQDSKGFARIGEDLKKKFGEDALYSKIAISYDKNVGTILNVEVTQEPSSMKMWGWTFMKGVWDKTTEITVELEDPADIRQFLFDLNTDVNMEKFGEMLDSAKKRLVEEKNVPKPTLSIASIMARDNSEDEHFKYFINLKPENGGTSYDFFYHANRELYLFNF